MKEHFTVVLKALLFICILTGSAFTAANTQNDADGDKTKSNRTMVIAINERDLYRYLDDKGHWQGMDIDLVAAIFRRLPYDYSFVNMPWPRVLKSLKEGSVDLTLSAANTPERRVYARFTQSGFRLSHNQLFVRTDKLANFAEVNSLKDLTNIKASIGVLRGAVYSVSYGALLSNKDFVSKLVQIDRDQNIFELVLKGRVDGYIDSELESLYYLAKHPELGEAVTPLFRVTSEAEAQSSLMFSKQSVSQAVVNQFDDALTDLHRSGEYQVISTRYVKMASSLQKP